MAKITQEQWLERYVKRQEKIAELKKELDALKNERVDKTKMNEEFREAFGLPSDFRVVKGRAAKQARKTVRPPSSKPR